MRPSSLVSFLAVCGLALTQSVNLSSIYGPGLSSGAEIFYASDPDWASEVTPRWTLYHAPTFYGAIKPATEADVQHIVKTSVARGIPFLATGGGHGVTTTLGRVRNGIEIDLSNFRTVEVSEDASEIVVGGAAIYNDIYGPMYKAGKMMAMGNSPCVGVIGAALGGAVGMWQGLYGVGVDSLLSVRLITAAGELVIASKTSHADLFWAIRGAGANFGIVTSATFQLHDAVNDGLVASTNFVYPGSANASVWEAIASFDKNMPNELAITAEASFNRTLNEPLILVNVNYYGPRLSAQPYLEAFHAAGPALVIPLDLPWVTLQALSSTVDTTDCTPGQNANEYTIALKTTDVATYTSFFNDLTVFWQQNPTYAGSFVIDRYPTAVMQEVPDNETAYPLRDALTQILFDNIYPSPSLNPTVNAFMRAARARFQKTSGFDELAVYVNFAQGDEGPRAWYSERKLGRLQRLKRTWDPNAVFSYSNPVPV
ncbi:FAD-binding domain-containing protein [Aspergillus heteromorphus CBS 117.55]|uniref:FAD-binding domain-containing protein n=1 Tax=Aspergillus heteromorphus CBS 117.55 TaxID=1448321 RepID=A0A317VXY9_9EURO|nr:FAD-binding domain-containing protein [Aspergillus heteromorphus CBS 117.55]PWY79153.1 FAD-binding domain-containing protein [Aspergillus heteromorphus CBS 117.55]